MNRQSARKLLQIIVIISMAASAAAIQPRPAAAVIPAFPGAEGFGSTTAGGRGGQVLFVTSLADSGPGTLRACAEASGPRLCLFRVAGTIVLQSRINIWNPYLTIAGQSAPGGGITLKNGTGNLYAPMAVLTHDVVIRYLRVRPGPSSQPSAGVDGITILHELDNEHPNEGVYNVVIDHASVSWATDEVIQTGQDVHDITIQWSILAEGLNCSTHPEGCNSKGMYIGSDGARNISVHHNLFVHNAGRNPMFRVSGTVDLVNNVMHVPALVAAVADGTYTRFPLNAVGNWVTAPNNNGQVYGLQVLANGASMYLKNNRGPVRTSDSQPESYFVKPTNNGPSLVVTTRHAAPAVTTTSAPEALTQVLAAAGATQGLSDNGAFFWRRDPVDTRVVQDVKDGVARLVDNPSAVGGWPTLAAGQPYRDVDLDGMADTWETRFGLNPGSAADNHQDADRDGYTNLEEFLNGTTPGSTNAPSLNRKVYVPMTLR